MKLFTDQSEVSAPSCIMFMLILLLQEFPNCTVLNFIDRQRSCGKVMFSQMFVCLLGGGLRYPFGGGPF